MTPIFHVREKFHMKMTWKSNQGNKRKPRECSAIETERQE